MTPLQGAYIPRVTPPAKITAFPTVFGRDQDVAFSAVFEAPEPSGHNDEGISVRVYNLDELDGEPLPGTKSLAEGPSNYDFSTEPRTEVHVTFESVKIPAGARNKLYVVVWHHWTFYVPLGQNPDDPTKTVGPTNPAGNRLGSATFSFQYGSGGKLEARAGYLKE